MKYLVRMPLKMFQNMLHNFYFNAIGNSKCPLDEPSSVAETDRVTGVSPFSVLIQYINRFG